MQSLGCSFGNLNLFLCLLPASWAKALTGIAAAVPLRQLCIGLPLSQDGSPMEKGQLMSPCCHGVRRMQGVPVLYPVPCVPVVRGAEGQTDGAAEDQGWHSACTLLSWQQGRRTPT